MPPTWVLSSVEDASVQSALREIGLLAPRTAKPTDAAAGRCSAFCSWGIQLCRIFAVLLGCKAALGQGGGGLGFPLAVVWETYGGSGRKEYFFGRWDFPAS